MRVSVGDVSLFFDVEGCALVPDGHTMTERPTLVLLHGGPGADHSVFKPEFSVLTDIAQIIYLDQRGSGRSDIGPPSSWTWTQWADDVATFCNALSIARPILVGSSSGGLVAMICAARYPQLVAGLILDSTLGVPTSLEETLDVFESRGGPVAREAARRHLSGDTSTRAVEAWQQHGLPLYGNPAAAADMARRRVRVRMNDAVQAHFRRGDCGPTDAADHLPAITCPTLILAGEYDPVSPAAAARRLAASFTSAPVTLEIFHGVGHGTFRQATQQAFSCVRRFLNTSSDACGQQSS
jgi:proline iminopeptidase